MKALIVDDTKNDRLLLCTLLKAGGFEIRNNIKRKKSYEKVPVIALTAYAMKGDKERLIASGFDDYMAKPIDVAEFIKKMNDYK